MKTVLDILVVALAAVVVLWADAAEDMLYSVGYKKK
jgi:hypothetical protein